MLRCWATDIPDAPMLTEGSTTLTWGEVYDRARRVSRALSTAGVVAGDRVAFLDRNGIEYFEVFFGCALLGAVSVAVNWRLAPAEMATDHRGRPGRGPHLRAPTTPPRSRSCARWSTCVRHWVALDQFAEWRDADEPGRAVGTRGSSRPRTTWSPSSTPRGPPGCPRGR